MKEVIDKLGYSTHCGSNHNTVKNRLEKLEFNVLESALELENKYPIEAQLDFLALENTIIANSNIIEKMQLLKKSQILHINQEPPLFYVTEQSGKIEL